VVCRAEPIRVPRKCIQAVHKGQIWANSHQLHFILQGLKSSTPLPPPNRCIPPEFP